MLQLTKYWIFILETVSTFEFVYINLLILLGPWNVLHIFSNYSTLSSYWLKSPTQCMRYMRVVSKSTGPKTDIVWMSFVCCPFLSVCSCVWSAASVTQNTWCHTDIVLCCELGVWQTRSLNNPSSCQAFIHNSQSHAQQSRMIHVRMQFKYGLCVIAVVFLSLLVICFLSVVCKVSWFSMC